MKPALQILLLIVTASAGKLDSLMNAVNYTVPPNANKPHPAAQADGS